MRQPFADNVRRGERESPGTSLSFASWKPDVRFAEISLQRGKLWQHMGTSLKGKLFCDLEEAMYMAERCNLLIQVGDKIASVKELYGLMCDQNLAWEAYYAYAYLRRAGYVVRRFPMRWKIQRESDLSIKGAVTDGPPVAEEVQGEPPTLVAQAGVLTKQSNVPPRKRRKLLDSVPDTNGDGGDGMRWWPSVQSQQSWLGACVQTLPNHTLKAVVGEPISSATFPNLWAFPRISRAPSGKGSADSTRCFDVIDLSGRKGHLKRSEPPKADLVVYVGLTEDAIAWKGITDRMAHGGIPAGKHKVCFVDGASVVFFDFTLKV